MSRLNKYKNVNDVVLALATEQTTITKLNKIKSQAKLKGNTTYVDIIENGIAKYNRVSQIEQARELGLLPEDVLNSMEIEEEVGWRGC